MRFVFPPARRSDVVDDHHGTLVPDPYRWMEDPERDETRAFIDAQNTLARSHLDRLEEVAAIRPLLEQMYDVARTGAPSRRSDVTVWSHNDGLSDQPVFLVAAGGEDRVLLDPNAWAEDGAVAVVVASLSPDGRHWAFSTAEGGSDWQVIRIRSTEDGRDLDEELRFVKFTSIAWWRDGFFYGRFPEQDRSSTEPTRDQRVMYHRLGTSQEDDVEWFSNPHRPDLRYDPQVTHDGTLVLLSEWNGTARENGLLYRVLDDAHSPERPWHRIVDHGVAVHDVVDRVGDELLVVTDLEAPNRRLVRLSLDDGSVVGEVVAESDDIIESAIATGGKVAIVALRDAAHRVDVYEVDGSHVSTLGLPGVGSVSALSGSFAEPDLFLGFESFLHPPSALRWSGDSVEMFAGASPPVAPSQVIVERLRAVSTDGAEVPMFIVRGANGPLPAPVELYGYGGFTVNLTPTFSPGWLAFVESGGVVAVANLRGGAEFGENWHRQGMLENKQQVFDDFISCAETLLERGVGARGSVGVRGRSNGGLLTAACLVQRPDLFGAVVSQVPVADMLRYQHFTAGRYWTVEYGDAADPDAFSWLHAYSPYHRASEVTDPPPVMVTTAEFDDRVVPMHSFKLAAALQHAVGGESDTPILLRVDTRSGHGLGKPVSKLVDEWADVMGFMLHHLRSALEADE